MTNLKTRNIKKVFTKNTFSAIQPNHKIDVINDFRCKNRFFVTKNGRKAQVIATLSGDSYWCPGQTWHTILARDVATGKFFTIRGIDYFYAETGADNFEGVCTWGFPASYEANEPHKCKVLRKPRPISAK